MRELERLEIVARWQIGQSTKGKEQLSVMGSKVSESRRTIAPGVDLVVKGEGVEPTDAVLAEVLCEMAAEAGGQLRFSMNDPAMVEEVARRLRAKDVDPHTGEWLC